MVHSKQQIKHRKQYNTIDNPENKETTNQLFTPTSPNHDQYSYAFCQTAAGFLIPRARLSYSPVHSSGFLIPRLARLSYSLALSTQSLQHKLSQPWISVIHKVLTRDDTPTRYDRGFVSVQYNMWRLTLTRGFVEISIFNQYSHY